MILSGHLAPGSRLTPERKFAEELGVNRSTVLNAYRELKSNGYAESRVGCGTMVVKGMHYPGSASELHDPLLMPWEQLFSESMSRSSDTTVRDLLKQTPGRDMILFAAGASAQGLDSLEELIRVQQEVVREYGHAVVSHMPTEGYDRKVQAEVNLHHSGLPEPFRPGKSLERRRQLLSLAYKYQVAILEDDPYGRLRYEGEDIAPLKALDRHGYVIYLSTFSKLLFPGFRVGWLAAPAAVLNRFTMLKQNSDLHTSSLTQLIFHRFIGKGLLEVQIRRVVDENASRRDIMLDELEKAAIGGVYWNRPKGGLYIWCRIPDGISQSKLLAKASEHGVAFVPGNAFYPNGPTGILEVPTDDDGMLMDKLEAILHTVENVKLIYVVPDFQNPSGRSWSLERRRRFMEIISRYGIPVLEDAPYAELRYEGEIQLPLKALDSSGLVIYLGTFSKVFCPGMRVGWVAADPDVLEKYILVKQGADLHTSGLTQRNISMYLDLHDLDEDVERLKSVYRSRRDVMIASMKAEFPEGVKYTVPGGGLFTWVELPPDIGTYELLRECLKSDVAFVPGGSFFPNGGGRNTMRLNFSNMSEERIKEGIKRLAGIIRMNLGRR